MSHIYDNTAGRDFLTIGVQHNKISDLWHSASEDLHIHFASHATVYKKATQGIQQMKVKLNKGFSQGYPSAGERGKCFTA